MKINLIKLFLDDYFWDLENRTRLFENELSEFYELFGKLEDNKIITFEESNIFNNIVSNVANIVITALSECENVEISLNNNNKFDFRSKKALIRCV